MTGLISDEYLDENGFYSLDREWEVEWEKLSENEKERHIKYLKMIRFVRRYPKAVKRKDMDWIFANMDVDITIIPIEWHNKYDLNVGAIRTSGTGMTKAHSDFNVNESNYSEIGK